MFAAKKKADGFKDDRKISHFLNCLKRLTLFYERKEKKVLKVLLHPKVIPITSIWVKIHKIFVSYVLEICFPRLF